MSVVRTHCGPLLAVCLLVVAFCGPLLAVDKNATEKSDDAKAAAKDRYKLPDDGSVKDLLAFIKEIRSFRPNCAGGTATQRQGHGRDQGRGRADPGNRHARGQEAGWLSRRDGLSAGHPGAEGSRGRLE